MKRNKSKVQEECNQEVQWVKEREVLEEIHQQCKAVYSQYWERLPTEQERQQHLCEQAVQAVYGRPVVCVWPIILVALVAYPILHYDTCQREGVKELIKDNNEVMEYLIKEVEFFNKCLGDPKIKVLLALKDELHIPDDQWQQVVSAFNLGKGGNLHKIEQLRWCLNAVLPVNPIPGWRGYEMVQLATPQC